MSSRTFQVGDDVKCTASFTNSAGTAIDPTVVTFEFRAPSASEPTVYVYLTDAQLVRDSLGHYHVVVDATESGKWFYRFYSTGTGKAADEGDFTVEVTNF